jgi:23S rRNA pseudouridine2605 synthase
MEERLQKVMAQAGIASRRKCEEIIKRGKVTVDGNVVTELGTKVDLAVNRVEINGEPLIKVRPVVYVLNKPRGIISSVTDPEGRKTVVDILKDEGVRLYPVGRLDYNTSGALLLTNDGELANALTHPKKGAPKKYLVKFRGVVSEKHLEQWRRGVELEDGTRTRPVVDIARVDESDGGTWVHVVLKEGKNRQIRRMAEATGLQISKLKRLSFAGITIEALPIGRYRKLTPKEIANLMDEYAISGKDFSNNDSDYNKEPVANRSKKNEYKYESAPGKSRKRENKVGAKTHKPRGDADFKRKNIKKDKNRS